MKQKLKPFSHKVASTMTKKELAPTADGRVLTEHLDGNGNTTHFTMKREGHAEPTLSPMKRMLKHLLNK
ncbi:hypothetical protein [Exiguobacterium aurantiacum]|uniref:hypothetical protein n=1 Tax=Exiguobacterium aurantiacum TaxID=33987 RepID=UPI00384C8837